MEARDRALFAAAIAGGGAAGWIAAASPLAVAVGVLAGIGALGVLYMLATALDEALRARYAPKPKRTSEAPRTVAW